MMKSVKTAVFFLMFALVLWGAAPVQAQEQIKGETYITRPLMKLGRGIANIGFAAFELPMKWHDVQDDMGGIAGITYGTLKGAFFVVARVCVGVVDIVTFPFPLPNCPDNPDGYGAGYGPLMNPAWVIDVNHDWWNFVYSREAVVTPNR